MNPVWQQVWKLQVPAKVKIFCWRVLHGTIPCNGILANRHIQTSSLCPVCKVHCEDIKHASFLCAIVTEIWENLGVFNTIATACGYDNTGPGALEAIIRGHVSGSTHILGVGLKELVATACWYTWWERRRIVRGEPVQNTAHSAQGIAAIVLNYARAAKPNSKIRRHGWERPGEGFVKLNIDAAFSVEEGSGATGAVIRDDQGRFVSASSCAISYVAEVPTAEARFLRDGLILAGNTGCNKVIVNSDCMEVIQVMQDEGNSIGAAAAIYEECYFLARNFSSISFVHCPRESNRVAHLLAS